MKRYSVVREILNSLEEDDVAIFYGEELIKEAYDYDRENNFYIDVGYSYAFISLALGMAITTDKKIFIFCNAEDFLRELSSVAQMAISKCKNIFCFIFDSCIYQEFGNQPTLFNELHSPKGTIFNLGIIAHDFTFLFKNKVNMKELKNIIVGLKGPLAAIIKVDQGLKKGISDMIEWESDLTYRIKRHLKKEKTMEV